MHIHLKIKPNKWPDKCPQHNCKNKKDDPKNDICLVYVGHKLYEDVYLTIAILRPNAHEQARGKK